MQTTSTAGNASPFHDQHQSYDGNRASSMIAVPCLTKTGDLRCVDRQTVIKPNREACDRCHSIKTRCVRTERSEVCIRCERLGSSCHYSPVGRTGRPLGSQKKTVKTSQAKSQKGFGREEENPRKHDGVSSIGEAEQAITSDSLQDSLFTDMDFYGLLSCTENDSLPKFLVDDLVREDHLAASVSAGVESSTGLPCTYLPTDQSSQDKIHAEPKPALTPLMGFESVSVLQKLVDIQLRLANLVQLLSTSPNIPENIEDVYRIIETLTGVFDELSGGDSVCQQQTPSPSDGAATLLFSSCYYSLIVACGHFVHMLQLDLQGSRNSSTCDSLSSPIWSAGPQSESSGSPLAISVGAFRLAMPRRALAKINLHLVKQNLQYLRSSVQWPGYNSFTGHSPVSEARTPPSIEENGYSPHTHSANFNPLAGLVETALCDLRQKENELFDILEIACVSEE